MREEKQTQNGIWRVDKLWPYCPFTPIYLILLVIIQNFIMSYAGEFNLTLSLISSLRIKSITVVSHVFTSLSDLPTLLLISSSVPPLLLAKHFLFV